MGAIAAVWYLGANVAYVVGYLFDNVTRGWTWMLGSSVIPCVIILIGRWSVPESPRWLYSKGRTEEAAEVVRGLYGQDVELGLQPEPTRTKFSKVFSRPYLWRVLFVGVIWLCQAIPMFAMYTYGPQISNAFRLGEGRNALLGEMVVGTFFLIGTIPAMFLAESLGRRKLVIGSSRDDGGTGRAGCDPGTQHPGDPDLLRAVRPVLRRAGQPAVAVPQ